MKEYEIEKFPKNKDEDLNRLSKEQRKIRALSKKKDYAYGDSLRCKKCGKEQPITEFYLKDETQRRDTTCRDCRIEAAGVLEVGKLRFAFKILDKGFRRCSICKDIQPISNFSNSKHGYKGKSNSCRDCSYSLSRKFITDQRSELGPFHIKQYGKKVYGIKEFTPELLENLKQEIIEKGKPKFFIDELAFFTKEDFSKYISEKYNISQFAVLKRIEAGYSNDKLVLSEHDARSLAYSQGKIKVTDTITGKVFIFENTTDKGLRAMFSTSAIGRCIKTGEKTKVTGLSKYKNPCTIERIKA